MAYTSPVSWWKGVHLCPNMHVDVFTWPTYMYSQPCTPWLWEGDSSLVIAAKTSDNASLPFPFLNEWLIHIASERENVGIAEIQAADLPLPKLLRYQVSYPAGWQRKKFGWPLVVTQSWVFILFSFLKWKSNQIKTLHCLNLGFGDSPEQIFK